MHFLLEMGGGDMLFWQEEATCHSAYSFRKMVVVKAEVAVTATEEDEGEDPPLLQRGPLFASWQ